MVQLTSCCTRVKRLSSVVGAQWRCNMTYSLLHKDEKAIVSSEHIKWRGSTTYDLFYRGENILISRRHTVQRQ